MECRVAVQVVVVKTSPLIPQCGKAEVLWRVRVRHLTQVWLELPGKLCSELTLATCEIRGPLNL